MQLLRKFILILIVLWMILLLSGKFFRFALQHNPNLKTDYITSTSMKPDILFLGPCEAAWVMDPAKIDPITGLVSYNLAETHSDFADNYLHLYLYLKHNPPPHYLFLYITGESVDSRYNVFNTYQFTNFLSDSTVASVVRENDPAYYRWAKFPFMQYGYYNSKTVFQALEGFTDFLLDHRVPYKGLNGFIQPDIPKWRDHVTDFMRLYPRGTRFKWDPRRKKYLVKIIRLALKNHINIYLYESPVWNPSKTYILNRKEVMAQIRQLGAKYGIPYLVFDTLAMSNDRNNFVTNLYTSHAGGIIFDSVFAEYFNRYIKNSPYPGML
ncbi:MAG TPA: hypothetical protein VNE41_12445 [Chitinophagaceae bacterium]|nr:hypothetical protein [Chitinophagaceae bacterium]